MIMHMGKKIICIKEIPSNLIEEAIFILKSDSTESKNATFAAKTKEIILDEAEDIVDEYINKLQEEKNREKKNASDKLKTVKKELLYIIGLFIILCICISSVI